MPLLAFLDFLGFRDCFLGAGARGLRPQRARLLLPVIMAVKILVNHNNGLDILRETNAASRKRVLVYHMGRPVD